MLKLVLELHSVFIWFNVRCCERIYSYLWLWKSGIMLYPLTELLTCDIISTAISNQEQRRNPGPTPTPPPLQYGAEREHRNIVSREAASIPPDPFSPPQPRRAGWRTGEWGVSTRRGWEWKEKLWRRERRNRRKEKGPGGEFGNKKMAKRAFKNEIIKKNSVLERPTQNTIHRSTAKPLFLERKKKN